MEKRKEVLEKAYKYLQGIGKAMKIKDVAAAMAPYGRRPETVSRALNGHSDYATDQFMVDFDKAFPGIFNLSWLLTGEGDMLAKEKPTTKEGDKMDVSVTIQILSNTVNLLQNELQNVRQELGELKAEVAKLQRVHIGYGSIIAVEDAQHYGIDKVK